MTDITTYPMIDDFDTTLAQAWDWDTGTVYLNEAVGITLPANTTTYIVVNPWKSIMQVAEIDDLDNTLKTVNVSNITVYKWAWVAYTQQTHPVWSVVRISTNYAFWKDIVDSVNSKVDTNTSINFNYYATTTARDADLPSPTIWKDYAFCLDTWLLYYYWWSWRTEFDTGTATGNASETATWLVEIPTQTQADAGEDTLDTGAFWSITPLRAGRSVQKNAWIKGEDAGGDDAYVVTLTPAPSAYVDGMEILLKATTGNTGACSVNVNALWVKNIKTPWGNDPQNGDIPAGKRKRLRYNGTDFVIVDGHQSTSAEIGSPEMATDAEAATGTNETRYINPKQNKRSVDRITWTRTWSSTGAQTLTHNLWKAPIFIYAIAKTNWYYISSFWMWCSEWNSAVWDVSGGVAIEPSLSDSALINFWNISGERSLNCAVTSVNNTDIVLNRTTIWSGWTVYDVWYTFFVFW